MIIEDVAFDRTRVYSTAVVACGYERRSSYLVRQGIQAETRIAIDLGGSHKCSYDTNWSELTSRGWTVLPLDEVLSEITAASGDGPMAVDVSSLPRPVMARLVSTLTRADTLPVVDYHYATGEFSSSVEAARESVTLTAGPLTEDFGGSLRAASIPIGLILGIGVERFRANGLMELLEPARVWQFVAQGGDPRFDALLATLQAGLGGSERGIAAIGYPIYSLRETYSRLSALLFSQSPHLRMILAPSGPKLFSLACLLAASTAEAPLRPAVWRVGSAHPTTRLDVLEAGPVTVGRVLANPMQTPDVSRPEKSG